MIKQNTSLFGANWCRRWVAPLMAVVVSGSAQTAMSQSTLRFVDVPAVVTEQSHVTIAPAQLPVLADATELKFVVTDNGMPMAAPQESQPTAANRVSAVPSHIPQPTRIAAAAPAATELRFSIEPQSMLPHVPQRQASVLPFGATESSNVSSGTELFTSLSQLQQSPSTAAFRPESHVPAAVPVTVDARPVGASSVLPTPVPAGTELFGTTSGKQWNVPALDYGMALKRIQPTTTPVQTAPKIAANPMPAAVTIKPVPMPSATELFAGTAQAQAHPQLMEAGPPPAGHQPNVAKSQVAVASRADSHQMATKAGQKWGAGAVSDTTSKTEMVPSPAAAELFASHSYATKPATIQPVPAGSELDFSRVPTRVERPQQQFTSVATTPAPILAKPADSPAVAMSTIALPQTIASHAPVTASPQSGVASSASPKAVGQPTPQLASAVVAPAASPDIAAASTPSHQVVVSQEANEPNVYKFRFAAAMDETHLAMIQNVGPEAVEPSGGEPAAMPGQIPDAPCGCDRTGTGIYGCPYLPGQSGTRNLCGVDCGRYGAPCCSTWSDAHCIPWSLFGPGEYVGPARPAHVDTYYLRVNDFITLTFIESRKKSAEHYRIGVGDRLQIEWLQGAGNTEASLNRELLVQPDGTVTLPLVGEVNASGKTLNDFRDEVVRLYSKYQRDPQITVTPLTVNVAVQDLLKAVTAKNQSSGQTQDLRVAPDGTIQAAGIGNVYVQGLTIDELRSELEARYAQAYGAGLTVSPQLTDRATSYVFMGGEVKVPGRYTLEGPTTVMQAIAMAGGWNIGGNVRQVVVFRRDENWCLKATKIDVRAPLYGNDPCPVNDVWLRENDLVLVPKTKILCATDMINLYFTRGVYAVFPINYVYDFSQNSGIVPIP